MTSESVTTSGPTAAATLPGHSVVAEYRIEIRGIIDVVGQSMPVSETFHTTSGVYEVHIIVLYVHNIVRLSMLIPCIYCYKGIFLWILPY